MSEVKRQEAQWMVDKRPQVDAALVRTAQIVGREGDKARELFYKLNGSYIDRRHVQIDQKVRSVDESSAENVQERLHKMLKRMIGSWEGIGELARRDDRVRDLLIEEGILAGGGETDQEST